MTRSLADSVGDPAFSVVRSDDAARTVLALRGELDIAGVPDVTVAAASIDPGARVTIDLSELSFIDSSGIQALMKLDVRSRAEGWSLELAAPRDAVRRALALCQFDKRVPISGDAPPAAG